ncbi:unnamed protein product [Effrenium voratum]|uniref:Uncharacterized protein n=1 Tax=Effrenium voratum TaxID=2562239 RepID=A0AA36I3V8_9DINO|nr:unnamed protein product [Effrenium voratum]
MLDLLRTLIEILRAHAWGTPRSGPCAVQVDTPWQFQVVCEILELSPSLLRKPLVPQANLCISLRLLAELEEAGLPASYQPEFGMRRISRQIQEMIGPPTPHTPGTAGTSGTDRMDRETSSSRQEKEPQLPREGDYQRGLAAISAFINAVKDYYQEFVPLRALAAANMSFLLQAEKAFKESGKVQRMSLGLENMCELPPDCNSVEGVVEAANLACEQLLALSEQGLPIVQPHVEYIHCAIDSAGLAMLNYPPGADPLQRLRWAEGIMAIQLAPLPIFDQTLRKVARCIDDTELAELAAQTEPPENMQRGALGTGVERLLVLKPRE